MSLTLGCVCFWPDGISSGSERRFSLGALGRLSMMVHRVKKQSIDVGIFLKITRASHRRAIDSPRRSGTSVGAGLIFDRNR